MQLICKDYTSDKFYLGKDEEKTLHLEYDYKDCYLKESYYNDYYTLKHVRFDFDYYNDEYDTHKDGYVDGHYAKSPKFDLKTHYKKLVIVIVNEVEKVEKKVTDVNITKVLRFPNSDDIDAVRDFLNTGNEGRPASFRIVLLCDQGRVVDERFFRSDPFEPLQLTNRGVRGTATAMETVEHKDLTNCRVAENEQPGAIEGIVRIQVTVDGDCIINNFIDNDAETNRFESSTPFDVPAGSMVSIAITDQIDNFPQPYYLPTTRFYKYQVTNDNRDTKCPGCRFVNTFCVHCSRLGVSFNFCLSTRLRGITGSYVVNLAHER